MADSQYSPDIIQSVLASIPADDLLKEIDYRVDKIECPKPFEFRCFCPIHQENIFRTLLVNDSDKTYQCTYNFCDGAKGGDLIDLFARVRQIGYDDSLRWLAAKFAPDIPIPHVGGGAQTSTEVARNYLELGALDEAINAYRAALADSPFDTEAHEGLYQAMIAAGNRSEAKSELSILLELYLGQSSHANVARIASLLLQYNPNDIDTHELIVDSLHALGDYDNAVIYQERLGNLLLAAGQNIDALKTFLSVEEHGNSNIRIVLKTIESMILSDQVEAALDRAKLRITQLQELGDAQGVQSVIMTLVKQGLADKTQREELFQAIDARGLNDEEIAILLQGASNYNRKGDKDTALEILEAMAAPAHGNIDFMEGKIALLEKLGKGEEARELEYRLIDRLTHSGELERAGKRIDIRLREDIGDVEALKRQVDLYEKLGDLETAKRICHDAVEELRMEQAYSEMLPLLEKLIGYEPDNILARSEFILALADSGRRREAGLTAVMLAEELVEEQRIGVAIERLEEFRQKLDDNLEIRAKLAELLLEQNQRERALDVQMESAKIAQRDGAIEKAQSILRGAIRQNPDKPGPLRELGELLEEIDRGEDAAHTYKDLAELFLRQNEVAQAEKVMERVFELSPEDTSSLRTMAKIFGSRHDNNSQVETLLKLAEICRGKKAYQRVITVIDDVLRLEPENLRAYDLQIDAYKQSSQIAEGMRRLSELAELLERRGERDEARNKYREILDLDATNLEARQSLLALLLSAKETEEALAEGLKVLAANRRLKRYAEARDWSEKLLEAFPEDVPLRETVYELEKETGDTRSFREHAVILANLYADAGDHENEIRVYRELLEFHPDDLGYRAGLIEALEKSEDSDEVAIQQLKLARDNKKAGRFEDAAEWFEKVLANDQANESALLELANLYADIEEKSKSIECFHRLISLYRDAGRDDEALVVLEKAQSVDKKNIELRRMAIDIALETQNIDTAVSAYIKLYEVYRVDQRHTQALEVINEAVGVKPDNPQLRRYLIDELRETGREAEAGEAEVGLVKTYLEAGDARAAEMLLDELSERDTPPPNLEEVRRQSRRLSGKKTSKGSRADEEAPKTDSKGNLLSPFSGDPGGESFGFRRQGPDRRPVGLITMRDFTFDSFVVGPEIQFAFATCMAVAKEPARQYNPLFLWGDVGLGKTHLINAVANHFAEHNPNLSVLYTSTDEFISQLVEAIQSNAVTAFRNNFRSTDMLIVDDIQFLSGKERAQEEFFHIFNVLFQAERQIVIASDRPPKSIAHLEDRLMSRFGAGVIIDMKPPGVETRMAIVKREVLRHELAIGDDVLHLIATSVEGNIRELKGAVKQICAMVQIGGEEITVESAQNVLDTLYT